MEANEAKKQMLLYHENRDKKNFLKRRAKLIRNHWRNGIAGVEDKGLTTED